MLPKVVNALLFEARLQPEGSMICFFLPKIISWRPYWKRMQGFANNSPTIWYDGFVHHSFGCNCTSNGSYQNMELEQVHIADVRSGHLKHAVSPQVKTRSRTARSAAQSPELDCVRPNSGEAATASTSGFGLADNLAVQVCRADWLHFLGAHQVHCIGDKHWGQTQDLTSQITACLCHFSIPSHSSKSQSSVNVLHKFPYLAIDFVW